jgi:hydroxyacylglutathione hydrolase
MGAMLQIEAIPAFADNYIWLLRRGAAAAVVDPGDAEPVIEVLAAGGLALEAVLLTHHHADHVGGVADLVARHPAPVFGPAAEGIPTVDRGLCDGQVVSLAALELELRAVAVPGHTAGHLAYLSAGCALVGDTLFAGGCGRVFEGSPEEMHRSLGRLAALPAATKIYCAHEYTVANLRFAREVEPANARLAARLSEALAVRAEGRPTLPSKLADELATNPFLRCGEAAVVAAAEDRAGRRLGSAAEVFAVVRGCKDGWRGP